MQDKWRRRAIQAFCYFKEDSLMYGPWLGEVQLN